MFYPPEVIEDIRTGNDIVDVVQSHVPLKQRGGRFFGLCPFHNEKTASFCVIPDKQMYHCFGCGASGNVFGFVMQIENHAFLDAVKLLAERIHYRLPEPGSAREAAYAAGIREKIFEMNTLAARFFYDTLINDGEAAAAYLDERRIGKQVRRKYGLGYAGRKWDALYKRLLSEGYEEDMIRISGLVVPDKKGGLRDKFVGRLMFPIFSAQGKVVGFGGRTLEKDGVPKYLNSPDTPVFEKSKNLYGINFVRTSRARQLIVVEGYMDVLALAQAGFKGAVAALGTAFNKDHVHALKKYAQRVTLLFDSDEAGTAAALRAIPQLVEGGVATKVLHVTDAKDPDEYINRFGADAFAALLDTAVDQVSFRIGCIQKQHDLTQTDGRVQFIQKTAKLLAESDSAVEREVYARETAKATGISYDSIAAEIARIAGTPTAVPAPIKRRAPRGNDRAVREAQKELLTAAADSRCLCGALQQVLSSGEMPDPVYARLLALIYETHESGRDWFAAEALSRFTDPDEQRQAAEVFAAARETPTDGEHLAISATDSLRKIKLFNIERRMQGSDDASELKILTEERKKAQKLGINLA